MKELKPMPIIYIGGAALILYLLKGIIRGEATPSNVPKGRKFRLVVSEAKVIREVEFVQEVLTVLTPNLAGLQITYLGHIKNNIFYKDHYYINAQYNAKRGNKVVRANINGYIATSQVQEIL
jgi:hypothetical protein